MREMTNHQYGPKAPTVDAFLEHLKQMTQADWLAVNDAWHTADDDARDSARDSARHFARNAPEYDTLNDAWHTPEYAVWDSARYAAWEILGADLLRERGQPFVFLPMFGFADEQAIIKREAPTITIFGVEVKGDHTFDRDSVERYIEQAYKAGQEDERAKIVAWLQWNSYGHFGMLANSIEAGEHLK